jgi:regulator of sigma E protease
MLHQPPIWVILLAFLCALGPLVFFHELGHYLVARLFRIPAEVFSIGFGREIVGWSDKQGTRWKVSWLPLGGYVRFVGDMSPASNPDDIENIPPELRDRAFQFQPVWKRFLVVLAGPAANYLLAIVILASFFAFLGAPLSNSVGKLEKDSPAQAAGIRPGDRIISIAGRSTPTFADIFNVVGVRPNERVSVDVERDGRRFHTEVKLGSKDIDDPSGQHVQRGFLGVYSSTEVGGPVGVIKAVPMAVEATARLTRSIFDGIVQLIRGAISPKMIGGPIKIAQVAGESATLGPLQFVELLALLSINLGFINLLPVPMLDGGHLFFYVIEAVRRRPVGTEALEWAFRGGLALIIALLLFATGNDLGLWNQLQRLIG